MEARQAQLQSIINQLEPLMSADQVAENKSSVQMSIATVNDMDEGDNIDATANPYLIDDDV